MIDAKPTKSSLVRMSVARQQEIIDTINRFLMGCPCVGFCFIGKPGTGKTYLMQSIQRTVRNHTHLLDNPASKLTSSPIVAPLITLADWQEDNLAESRSGKEPGLISSKTIRDTASENKSRFYSRFTGDVIYPFTTLHYFIDEFDSQPTVSEYSASKVKTFINSCYTNAPRYGGNTQYFVQLVIAMNKSWKEFTSSYGLHVSRRIAEMCVRIDFDRAEVIPPPPPPPPAPAVVPDLGEDSWFTEAPAQGSSPHDSKKSRVEDYEAENFEETEKETIDETRVEDGTED